MKWSDDETERVFKNEQQNRAENNANAFWLFNENIKFHILIVCGTMFYSFLFYALLWLPDFTLWWFFSFFISILISQLFR